LNRCVQGTGEPFEAYPGKIFCHVINGFDLRDWEHEYTDEVGPLLILGASAKFSRSKIFIALNLVVQCHVD
jgi:hypothetical protein